MGQPNTNPRLSCSVVLVPALEYNTAKIWRHAIGEVIFGLIHLYQGPVLSDRTHHFVTSPVLEDFLRVSHFGVFESFMPAPSIIEYTKRDDSTSGPLGCLSIAAKDLCCTALNIHILSSQHSCYTVLYIPGVHQ